MLYPRVIFSAVQPSLEIYTLSLHDALPICMWRTGEAAYDPRVKQWLGLTPEEHIVSFLYVGFPAIPHLERKPIPFERSEEHTSELQSRRDLVCRLLLEKKKNTKTMSTSTVT